MRVHRITANLRVDDIAAARDFYAGYLGLAEEEFDLGWVVRLTAPGTQESVQLVTRDATATAFPAVSVHCDDVDAAYAEALARRLHIVHPLTTEEWGVRRFFVRAPDGTVVNVVQHRD
jgi:catechol 2,3-dioxygenase-like lactoylglutathione lyase family enzyme